MDMLHDDAVLQTCVRTQFFSHRLAQQGHVVLFEPFVKELRGDLDRQNLSIELHRLDGANHVLNAWALMLSLMTSRHCAQTLTWSWFMWLQVRGSKMRGLMAGCDTPKVGLSSATKTDCECLEKLSQKKISSPLIFDEF